MSTTVPSYTGNTANNIRSDSSLAASATANYNVDYHAKFEAMIHVKNTPGGTIAATAGVKVEVFRRYGATPTTGESAFLTFTLPSAATNTAESIDFFLGPGYYNIKVTNLDASNAVTVGITGDTFDSVTTT